MFPRPGRIRNVIDVRLPRPRDRSSRDFLKIMGKVFEATRHDVVDDVLELRTETA
jgi:hypothetical protein